MANDRHRDPAATPTNSTQGLGTGQHEDSEKLGVITGSCRQGSTDTSSRFLLADDSIKEDNFELLWRLRKYLVLLGVLAVSVTYNAGLTPPGGFWTLNKDSHHAGDPALHVGFSQRYEVFFYCNATALAASLVLIILLISKRVTRQRIWLRSMQLTMILDLFSLLGAYAAGSCRALKSSIYIWILVLAVFLYVGIHTLVTIKVIPKSWTKKLQTVLFERQVSAHLEKDIDEARKFILMLVTFAATITYQAGLNPPGGFWAENEYDPDSKLSLAFRPYKHRPASSVLRSNYLRRYNIFVIFNSTSFVASLVIIILLLNPELSRHGIRTRAVMMCVIADILCLIGAYAAGCCRDMATSFYVLFIIIIVLTSFAVLAVVFVYKPVADWLGEVKSGSLRFMDSVGRVLSWSFSSKILSNAQPYSSPAGDHQSVVHSADEPAHDSDPESEYQSADNQQVLPSIEECESPADHPPAEKQHTTNIDEAVTSSQHQSGNSQQSAICKDVVLVPNIECQYTDYQLVPNMKEGVTNSQHPPGNNQQSVNTNRVVSILEYRSSTDNQQAASAEEQSSTDNLNTTAVSVEQSMSVGDSTRATNHDMVKEEPSIPIEAINNVDCAEQNSLAEAVNHDIETGASNNPITLENGHINSNDGVHDQNSGDDQTEKHLKKTRTYLLLLAILAVSLTYQSGLNPPGGFWSRSENHHSPGDRILEDTHHPRFIAFFYLNAVAFVASIVMIIMLLNKMMSKKVTKRRELPTMMIAVLLSLTGAFVLGSCREANKSIYISMLLCLGLGYVAIHVLIAIHVIPKKWKRKVSVKPKHSQAEGNTSEKELERRRNLLLTLAILAATVTYQAAMNPPGGVWSDDKDVTGTPGNPILQDIHPKRYDVFFYSNSVSFVLSVVMTILLVNKESCEHGIKSYALRVCLVVGLLSLLIAYVAGTCRNWKQSVFLSIIALAVLVSLVIQVLLSSKHHALGRALAQFVEYLQRHLFPTGQVRRGNTSSTPEASDRESKIARKRHKFLMILAILAASITYQAGMNPPGGFWSDDEGHVAGNPILHDINHQRYKTFFCFNSFSFMASIVVIMLLLSKSVRKKDVPLEVLHLIMILDLLALMTAFAAGSCRKFSTSIYVYLLVLGVVVYLVLVIVLSRRIAKCLMGPRERSGRPRHPERASRSNTPIHGQQV